MTENEHITVDTGSITTREAIAFEKATGIAYGVDHEGEARLLSIAGFIWIVKRRTDPDYTFEEALDVPHRALIKTDAEPDPTSPPNRAARRSKSG